MPNKINQFNDVIEKHDKNIKSSSYLSAFEIENYYTNAENFHKIQPFFFDRNENFWFWNYPLKKWELVDETDIMNELDTSMGKNGITINPKLKNNYMEAFRRVGRRNIPKEMPKEWVQFKDKIYNLKTQKEFEVTPEYFCTNPIPHALGDSEDCPMVDKLLTDWVGDRKEQLYEVLAYCMLTDYPIHSITCLIGSGGNGKSRFLELLSDFIGNTNITSTELDTLMDSRFETFKLYRKLACIVGETNFGTLNKSSMIKKLAGQDLVSFEQKNKKPFEGINYAKIIIASNSLPTSTDTTLGFYRRWRIISFDNTFPDGQNVIKIVPECEYEALARKCLKSLVLLLERGQFLGVGTVEDRKREYILNSNPISHFIELHCEKDVNAFIKMPELFNAYIDYLKKNSKRLITFKTFIKVITEEGYELERTSKKVNETWINGTYILGLSLKNEVRGVRVAHGATSTQPPAYENRVEVSPRSPRTPRNLLVIEEEYILDGENLQKFDEKCQSWHFCEICKNTPTNEFFGKNYCKLHFEQIQKQKKID